MHRELQAHLLTVTSIQSLGAMCIQHFKDRLYEVVRDCQHGFIRGKSCTSNLLEVLDHVGSLLDDGKQLDMIYIDMSKTFDKVNHRCLLQKFGFGGSLLQWFSSYLLVRYQRVTVMAETSALILWLSAPKYLRAQFRPDINFSSM